MKTFKFNINFKLKGLAISFREEGYQAIQDFQTGVLKFSDKEIHINHKAPTSELITNQDTGVHFQDIMFEAFTTIEAPDFNTAILRLEDTKDVMFAGNTFSNVSIEIE